MKNMSLWLIALEDEYVWIQLFPILTNDLRSQNLGDFQLITTSIYR